jgi:RNA polymerase sigma-70 factor (ECF subfamily)
LTPDAIQRLYRTHAFAVQRRCRQLLGDEDEARDAMHEVFLRLLEEPGRFQGRSSPATFLFAVATHRCLTRLRDRRARGAGWQESVARSMVEGRPGAADAADAAEARQLAAAILAEADPETATMALYHFVDGLSQGEVASLVGRSRVTVNQRLQRFRADARRRAEGT